MVVDDHEQVAEDLRSNLAEQGYTVETCGDPAIAYERCAAEPARYKLVFMDVRFPAGDVGIEAARRIKALAPQGGPRVVLMTGLRGKFDSISAELSTAADGVLLKPLFKWLVIQMAEKHCPSA